MPEPKYLLDTDICSYLILDEFSVPDEFHKRRNSVFYSEISLTELMSIVLSKRALFSDRQITLFFQLMESKLFLVDSNDWSLCSEIHAALLDANLLAKDNRANFDMLIASVAINRDLILVTGNDKHFKKIATVTNLKYENWAVGRP